MTEFFQGALNWEQWGDIVVAAGLVIGAVVVALVAHRIIVGVVRRLAAQTESELDNAIVANCSKPALLLIVLFAVFIVLPSLTLPADVKDGVARILTLAMTAGVGWLLVGVAGVASDTITARYDITASDNLAARRVHTRMRVLHHIAVAAIVLVTLGLILMAIPSIRQIGVSLFASAGIASIIIGFAARPVLGNLIAGVQLALTEPIRIDDVVIVEGEWGWIEEIRATFVVVRIWDQRRLVVPISYFNEKPFQNWTRNTADILGTVYLYVDYTVPVGAIREELKRIVEGSPLWDGRVCVLQVTDSTERTVELRALMSAEDSGRAWDLRCAVREALIGYFQREFPDALPRVRAELRGSENPSDMLARSRAKERSGDEVSDSSPERR